MKFLYDHYDHPVTVVWMRPKKAMADIPGFISFFINPNFIALVTVFRSTLKCLNSQALFNPLKNTQSASEICK